MKKCSAEIPSKCRYHGFTAQTATIEKSMRDAETAGDFNKYFEHAQQKEKLERDAEKAEKLEQKILKAKESKDFKAYAELRSSLYRLTGVQYAKEEEPAEEVAVEANDSAAFTGSDGTVFFDASALPATETPEAVVSRSGGWNVAFKRADKFSYEGYPSYFRVQADQHLDDEQKKHIAQLLGYNYASTVRGEGIPDGESDTPHSLIFFADTTKGNGFHKIEEFISNFEHVMKEGSPVRKTNKAGPGTQGTRLVDGFGDSLKFTLYVEDDFSIDYKKLNPSAFK